MTQTKRRRRMDLDSRPARRGVWFLAALALAGCTKAPPRPTSSSAADDDVLFADVAVDRGLMVRVKTSGLAFERLIGITPDFEEQPAKGVVLLTEPGRGHDALRAVRGKLEGSPYAAYLYDDGFGRTPDRIAILEAHDDYGYLAVVRPDGINYDLDHEKVLEVYRRWDAAYGLALVGASQDWIEAEIKRPPSDWLAFAQEVYEFCPDVVDQGTNDVETLAREMRERSLLYLWWD